MKKKKIACKEKKNNSIILRCQHIPLYFHHIQNVLVNSTRNRHVECKLKRYVNSMNYLFEQQIRQMML